MTAAGFIQPTANTQDLHDKIAALREQRQGVTAPDERQRLHNAIGKLSDQIRRIHADEQREKRAELIRQVLEQAKE